MSILVVCPACRQTQQAPDSLAGQIARCSCGVVIAVPDIPATAALLNELSPSDYRNAYQQGGTFSEEGTALPFIRPSDASAQPTLDGVFRAHQSNMPPSVRMATFALGWCGGLAMVVIATACIGVMFYPTQLDWRVGSTIIGFAVVLLMIACGNLWAMSLVQFRRPMGRVLAMLMIVPNFFTVLCGGMLTRSSIIEVISAMAGFFLLLSVPCSVFAALAIIVGLFTREANQYFRQR